MQQQRLAQEMQDAAVVSIIQKRPKMKASRSLPAMVLKPGPKSRVCGMGMRERNPWGGGEGEHGNGQEQEIGRAERGRDSWLGMCREGATGWVWRELL